VRSVDPSASADIAARARPVLDDEWLIGVENWVRGGGYPRFGVCEG
jgi:hypothetical protein